MSFKEEFSWRNEDYYRLKNEVDDHRGKTAIKNIDTLQRSYRVFKRNHEIFYETLLEAENNQATAAALLDDLNTPVSQDYLERLDQTIHAATSSMSSLIDMARWIMKPYEQTDLFRQFDSANKAIAKEPTSIFLRKLRNYVSHFNHVPWALDPMIYNGIPKCPVGLGRKTLLEYSWENASVKKFIEEDMNKVRFREIIKEYMESMEALWPRTIEALLEFHAEDFKELCELIDQRDIAISGKPHTRLRQETSDAAKRGVNLIAHQRTAD